MLGSQGRLTAVAAALGVALAFASTAAAGIRLVKDVNPGPGGSAPGDLVDLGRTLVFTATDPGGGLRVWRSDGSAVGTVAVGTIDPTGTGTASGAVRVGSEIFFVADDGIHGAELWKTDGTSAGTDLVADINPGATGSAPAELTDVAGTLFFTADDGVHGRELWRSDGTSAGTTMVADIFSGAQGSGPSSLTAAGSVLYFAADDGVHGRELWRSDGTQAGTTLVKDVLGDVHVTNTNTNVNTNTNTNIHTNINTNTNTNYNTNTNTSTNTNICNGATSVTTSTSQTVTATQSVTTTTSQSTSQLVTQQTSVSMTNFLASDPALSSSPEFLAILGGRVFFAASGHASRQDTSSSTSSSTSNSTSTSESTSTSTTYSTSTTSSTSTTFDCPPNPLRLLALAWLRPFSFERTSSTGAVTTDDRELWSSDGTATGTSKLADIAPGDAGSSPADLTVVNQTLFFTADDGVHGRELWRSDGTAAGTQLVADIAPGAQSSSPANLTAFDGACWFTANDGVHGTELWRSDGTAAGTTMVADINPGAGSSSPSDLTRFDGRLFFSADDGVNGSELWSSDGTSTRFEGDLNPGPAGSNPHDLTPAGGALFFAATDAIHGTELFAWRAPQPLSATGTTATSDEGSTAPLTVATFTDPDPLAAASHFTATIDWGDGTAPDAATIVAGATPGSFSVVGSHPYADEGTHATAVNISAVDGRTVGAAGSLAAGESDALVGSGLSLTSPEGAPFNGVVATFTGTFASATAGDFAATIDWGDGTTAPGTATLARGLLSVSGEHAYADEGRHAVHVTVTDDAPGTATAAADSTLTVGDADVLAPQPVTIATTEGNSFTGTVATFADSFTAATAADFAATIDWGDGTTSTGNLVASTGGFAVTGAHAYRDEGSYSVSATLADDAPGTASATARSTANVADADTFTGTGGARLVQAGVPTVGALATFTDPYAAAIPSDLAATVSWGDGAVTAATVSGSGGLFTVSGSHAYLTPGTYAATVTLDDDGGGAAGSATVGFTVYGVVSGMFVIGDGNATLGGSVLFWGSQWWKANTLAGGSPPAAFKGFAPTPQTPTCGAPWSARTGASSAPPPSVPSYLAIGVTSTATKSGSTITGRLSEVVVIRTDPGYGPEPSQPGTGTVVGVVCGP